MAECGHCGKHVKGIRDHIRAKHGDNFYEQGPDNRYYSYKYLRDNIPGTVIVKPHWDSTYTCLSTANPLQQVSGQN